jgi:hypothetical protein
VSDLTERWSKISERERVLLVLGAIVLVFAFELVLRVLPARKELALAEQQVRDRAAPPRPGPAPDAELGRLVARRAGLAKKLEAEKDARAKLEVKFAREEPQALVAISELAQATGVLVRESAPYRPQQDELSRPRRRLVVVATFAALRAFTASLARLETGPVHVQSFELDAVALSPDETDPEGAGDVRVLVATLVVVL